MAPGETSGSIAADCWVSARMARKRCQWRAGVEGRPLSCRRRRRLDGFDDRCGEMRASSMAAEGETTGTISMVHWSGLGWESERREVERQNLVDGEVLRGEDAIETFEERERLRLRS